MTITKRLTHPFLYPLAMLFVFVSIVHSPPVAESKPRPELVVGKDPAGDWGAAADKSLAPLGDLLGQDLVKATIGMEDPRTLRFTIQLNSLPPWGGWPEFTRYIWDMRVDGKHFFLDGKFTNYSNGACNPLSGGCPPAQDPGLYPFLVKTDCRPFQPQIEIIVCDERGVVQATFAPDSATIKIPVPLRLLGARAGSRIAPTEQLDTGFGGSLVAVPAVFMSPFGSPEDALQVMKTFVVPDR